MFALFGLPTAYTGWFWESADLLLARRNVRASAPATSPSVPGSGTAAAVAVACAANAGALPIFVP